MKLENYEVHLPSYSIGNTIYNKIGPVCESYGKTVLVIGGKLALEAAYDKIKAAVDKTNLTIIGKELFGEDCTYPGLTGTVPICGSPSISNTTSSGFIPLNSSTVLTKICDRIIFCPISRLAHASYCALLPAAVIAFTIAVFIFSIPLCVLSLLIVTVKPLKDSTKSSLLIIIITKRIYGINLKIQQL